nr:InlB B-repeat-containing protein [Candidatus Enterousia merdequi]
WTANTINLKWYNGETEFATNTCTYDGGITLPASAPRRTGYNFAGWQVKITKINCESITDEDICMNTDGCTTLGPWQDFGNCFFDGCSNAKTKQECYHSIWGDQFCSWQDGFCIEDESPMQTREDLPSDFYFYGESFACKESSGIESVGEDGNEISLDLDRGEWWAKSRDGIVVQGFSRCSSSEYDGGGEIGNPIDDGGEYCWCQVTSIGDNPDSLSRVVNPVWVSEYSLESCVDGCAMSCVGGIEYILRSSAQE